MNDNASEDQVGTAPLFTLQLTVGEAQAFGTSPQGGLRFAPITGGYFEGEHLRGRVLAGGADWIRIRSDGVRAVDVRISLETDDGSLIAMRYEGFRLAAPEILERDRRGAPPATGEYWYRVAAFFECEDGKYGWLNRTLALGLGTRQPPNGPTYRIYALR